MSGARTQALKPAGEASGEAPAPGHVVRQARPGEHAAVDALIDEAYAHDYGPSEGHGEDPFRSSEVRARIYEVWVAVEGGAAVEAGAPVEANAATERDAAAAGVGGAGELLGSATFRRPGTPPLHEDFGPETLDLRLLGVSPRARRRGIAAALMRQAVEQARVGGFSDVALKTQPHMTGAHRLYEALGFERAPERDGLWIGGERVLDLLAYRYRLSAEDSPRPV